MGTSLPGSNTKCPLTKEEKPTGTKRDGWATMPQTHACKYTTPLCGTASSDTKPAGASSSGDALLLLGSLPDGCKEELIWVCCFRWGIREEE
jgi:hypothetical protein